MRRTLSLVFACVLLGLVTVASAAAESGVVVQKSWVSSGSGTPAVTVVKPGVVTRVYANFVWARAPKPGQGLRIQWIDPNGDVQAVWSGKTLSTDRRGDRLFSWIGAGVLAPKPGLWQATLSVGGVVRSTRAFRVAPSA
jgi:hypothetical protein